MHPSYLVPTIQVVCDRQRHLDRLIHLQRPGGSAGFGSDGLGEKTLWVET